MAAEQFTIDEVVDRFKLFNLPLKESFECVDVFKDILYKGENNYLASWTDRTKATIPSTEIYYAIAKALFFYHDKKEKEDMKKLLQQDFQQSRITSTMLFVLPPCKVVHYYNTPLENLSLVDLRKQRTGFLDSFHIPLCNALFGTDDIKEIQEVFYWLSDKKPFLEMAKNSPLNYFNVVFQTNRDRFSILANKNWTLQAREIQIY